MNVTKMVLRISMITGAVALTCTPAAIAISGSAESVGDDATAAQYGQATPTPTVEVQPTATSDTPPAPPESTTPPTTQEQGASPTTGPSLPFTGGPVLPIVLAAFVLLTTGALLRRASNARPRD